MVSLNTPITQLNRVGATAGKALARLGVKTAQDLLLYFPYRYDDFRRVVPVNELVEGEAVTIKVKLSNIAGRRSFKRKLTVTEALAGDDSGSVRIIWFNQPYIAKTLKTGDELYISGTVEKDMLGPKFNSPSFEKVKPGVAPAHTARLVPIYPLTKGVSAKQIRFLLSTIIDLAPELPEWLPPEVLDSEDLTPYANAVVGMHYPEDETEHKLAERRLKFDELLLIQMKAELARRERSALAAPHIAFREPEIKAAVADLPFTLTGSQKVAAWEIMKDLGNHQPALTSGRGRPMNRLLSGDVGSGKTVVAGLALYLAKLNGCQSTVMAPTEILAYQHFLTLKKLFGDKFSIALLTNEYADFDGVVKNITHARQRKALLSELASGHIDVIVGTQALLVDDVGFKNLGLVVVDEQHRFGVAQRRLMKQKVNLSGRSAHFLSMTATPIPRSLALVMFGDLDVSLIPELPPGRKPIASRLVPPSKRDVAYDFVRKLIKQGQQMFVVCPLIEQTAPGGEAGKVSGALEKKTVMTEYEKLSKKIFPEFKVGYLHGKMKGEEKEKIMKDFKDNKTQILVSTSVIEVGVDVPNACVMLIEGAERFGLAQLHQFRGRVGRGDKQSFCFLFTDNYNPRTRERLEFFVAHDNGFALAEKDLELRGPGEVYGTEQSGLSDLKFARLTDEPLIAAARQQAHKLVGDLKKYPAVNERVKQWESKVHLE